MSNENENDRFREKWLEHNPDRDRLWNSLKAKGGYCLLGVDEMKTARDFILELVKEAEGVSELWHETRKQEVEYYEDMIAKLRGQ